MGVNVRFSENLTCFVFLKQPFWDSPFLPYYQQPIFKNICEWLPRGIVIFDVFQIHLERNLENERLYCTTETLNFFILIHQYSLILIFFAILPSNSSIHDSPQQYSFLWMNYLKIWKYNAFQTFHTVKFFSLTFTSTCDCKENW